MGNGILVGKMLRIVVAEVQPAIRKILITYIATVSDLELVGEADSADQALELVTAHRPDVLLLCVDLPGAESFEIIQTIHATSAKTRVIAFAKHAREDRIDLALRAEAWGYITNDEPVEAIHEAVKRVASGKPYFSPSIRFRIEPRGGTPKRGRKPSPAAANLTPRQAEVVRYLAEGLTVREIAAKLGLSEKTVDNHKTSVMRKLNLHNRAELARFAIREGLIDD